MKLTENERRVSRLLTSMMVKHSGKCVNGLDMDNAARIISLMLDGMTLTEARAFVKSGESIMDE